LTIARALGATPGQVTAGLATAFLLPAVPGAALGTLLGIGVFWLLRVGNDPMAMPSTPMLTFTVLAVLAATTVLAAIPARIGAMRSVTEALESQSG
jgi:putative ABC transport system permease protein